MSTNIYVVTNLRDESIAQEKKRIIYVLSASSERLQPIYPRPLGWLLIHEKIWDDALDHMPLKTRRGSLYYRRYSAWTPGMDMCGHSGCEEVSGHGQHKQRQWGYRWHLARPRDSMNQGFLQQIFRWWMSGREPRVVAGGVCIQRLLCTLQYRRWSRGVASGWLYGACQVPFSVDIMLTLSATR